MGEPSRTFARDVETAAESPDTITAAVRDPKASFDDAKQSRAQGRVERARRCAVFIKR
jgi:hypothetical protein